MELEVEDAKEVLEDAWKKPMKRSPILKVFIVETCQGDAARDWNKEHVNIFGRGSELV